MTRNAKGQAARGFVFDEPLVFERSVPGRRGYAIPPLDVPEPDDFQGAPLRRRPPRLPELSEPDVVRHYTRLSQWNFSIDAGLYPLGSCTMKYNPRLNEDMAAIPGLADLHPQQPEASIQGALALMVGLEDALAEITGMDATSLQPAAGAHGELTGLLLMRSWLESQGNPRSKLLVPTSAHGTNPASATLCGYRTVEVPSGPDGIMEPADVAEHMDEDTAGLMVTHPNTLGLYEAHLREICEIVHARGGLVYGDGANLNALMGLVRPGHLGVDVMHLNLHKTFSTPHGGGGPGAGPVTVVSKLEPFLPTPVIRRGEVLRLERHREQSIGRVRSFFGNFGILVRAYTYILEMGRDGLTQAARQALLNANYLRARLSPTYEVAYDRPCMHEVVLTDARQRGYGVETMDIAKRLLDYGFHPPTVYFPLVVKNALMVEPTETESRDSLDAFVDAMEAIDQEARTDPDPLHTAPHRAVRRRLDEVRAARSPDLCYDFGGE